MRIALLYVDAGKGHITPAKALSDAFERLGHSTVVEDLFVTCNAPLVNWMSKNNWRMMLHFPRLEAIVDPRSDTAFNAKVIRFFSTHSHGPKDFQMWYEEHKPDLIVVTHFLAANLIKPLVESLGLQVPVFEYAADVFFTPKIGIHPSLDRLYICTELGKELAINQGQPEASISICPFPLKTGMMNFIPYSKEQARKNLGLENQFTVLLNLGGEGIGKVDFLQEVVDRQLDWQVITVGELSTSTRMLYKQFMEKNPTFKLITPGFVDNIQDYICACDVQAGKAGANALMESLFLKRPFLISNLLYAAWPTSRFFERHHVGWVENSVRKQVDILQEYASNPDKQAKMEAEFLNLPLAFSSDACATQMAKDATTLFETTYAKPENPTTEAKI